MRILAVATSGQVGCELSKGGAQPGLDILALDRAALDIADSTAVDRTVKDTKPSLVVNAAAYATVDRAESEPELAFVANREVLQRPDSY